jgi:hypothetical protein
MIINKCQGKDTGCGMRNTGCGMPDTGYRIRDAGYRAAIIFWSFLRPDGVTVIRCIRPAGFRYIKIL